MRRSESMGLTTELKLIVENDNMIYRLNGSLINISTKFYISGKIIEVEFSLSPILYCN